jgi:hypothetical protein
MSTYGCLVTTIVTRKDCFSIVADLTMMLGLEDTMVDRGVVDHIFTLFGVAGYVEHAESG